MITRRKVITFLIALVGAALLWLYVVTAVAPEATITHSSTAKSLWYLFFCIPST